MNIKEPLLHWIRLFFKIIFKSVLGLLFFCYVTSGIGASISLYMKNGYRAQDISAISALIDKSAEKGDTTRVAAWLNSRPLAETDKLVDMIKPKSGVLSPWVFFEIFRREDSLGRTEDALFWMQLARFRLRYDIIRCKSGLDGAKNFDGFLSTLQSPKVDVLLDKHPEMLKKTLQKVLDFDLEYPAIDNPTQTCKTVSPSPPINEDEWDIYHESLRRSTEKFINSPDAKAADTKIPDVSVPPAKNTSAKGAGKTVKTPALEKHK